MYREKPRQLAQIDHRRGEREEQFDLRQADLVCRRDVNAHATGEGFAAFPASLGLHR